MNALRPTILRSVARASRTKATLAAAKPSAVPPFKKYNFKESWLSDPSTYPIMVIMSCAMCFMVGMGANALTYKDVQIDPRKRNSILTTWGQEERNGVVKTYSEKVLGGVKPEGLGIDHDEWLKAKKAEGGRF